MRTSDFMTRLIFLAKKSGLSLSDETMQRINEIYLLLGLWSKKINITSNLSCDDFIIENFLDPALAFLALTQNTQISFDTTFADVGCGGGFVGFTWHLLNHERSRLVLIDSDRKKINFCKDVVRKLSLKNCTALCSRVEDVHESLADIVVTRATWDPGETKKRCVSLALPNAIFVHFCGPRSADHSGKAQLIKYFLPPLDAIRYLSVVR